MGSESEGNQNKNKEINSSIDGESKPKRHIKTPFQIEVLENSYAMDKYPSELTRVELSKILGLSDRQLQTWFCHRRLKGKKDAMAMERPKSVTAVTSPLRDSPMDELSLRGEPGSDNESGSGSGSGSLSYRESGKAVMQSGGVNMPIERGYYESSPQSIMEQRAIACVEAQLGEPLRDDGPVLGMIFDSLPPGAFEAPIAMAEQQQRSGHPAKGKAALRALPEYQFREDPSGVRADVYGPIVQSNTHDSLIDDHSAKNNSSFVRGIAQLSRVRDSEGRISHAHLLAQSDKQGGESSRISREVEVHDDRIQKEIEKQEILKRKSEERSRKEMEKMEREKLREEEKSQREQKRENERRQRSLQREHEKAEKMKQKEELRIQRETVRCKAAMEKAIARNIAKESMELFEDEQLELMELAAASKGLQSIINLDHETLQNLELFKGNLVAFPPKYVVLKKAFAIQPWADSDENTGNLFMVWRFLISYADILGLWPFTLDEFVQALHDYDSRLLGEIHVALLKLIIKDIEDVARTPPGSSFNLNGGSSTEGGHPRIVEGAYTWGFDIRNWQQHLNPLTWSEILRQLALSAGFGPQLKKKSQSQAFLHDSDEVRDSEEAVSKIRNGSAVENAVEIMREKGLLQRKSRHRLTPGTVKFAAFHVLSLEGSKGLTVLELVDKIQKSGLRDLTTSKTPEASISVALTRDGKLFKRIAPSTYCVRAAFVKDPADAEAVISEARKKIQIFENGFIPEEDADVERDDSECEADLEVEDIATLSNANKNAEHFNEVNACSERNKENYCIDVPVNMLDELANHFQSVPLCGFKDLNCSSTGIEQFIPAGKNITPSHLDQESAQIDESMSGETWIQGFTEGDYSDLSVEERLNSLVALIGIANEGNSIRTVLEDRWEAATALKKQMWAELQLDKVRLKDENVAKLYIPSSYIPETTLASTAAEGSQGPFPIVDTINSEAFPIATENPKFSLSLQGVSHHSLPSESTSAVQSFMGQDNFIIQQYRSTSKKSRAILKSYIAHRAEETHVYRSLPLGEDRKRNRYWHFVVSASRNDPGCGRIFVESYDGKWRLIDSEEAFDALLTSLDIRGIRESHLCIMLQKIETSFKETVRKNLQCNMGRFKTLLGNEAAELDSCPFSGCCGSPSSMACALDSNTMENLSSFKIELGRTEVEKKAALEHYLDFQRWMWKECFNSSTLCAMKHGKKRCIQLLGICEFCLASYFTEDVYCNSCHQTFGNSFDFLRYLIHCDEKKKLDPRARHVVDTCFPLGIRLLKAMLVFIEASILPEALQSSWTEDQRKTWGKKLNAASSTEELLQFLTLLESSVIKPQYLSSNFETTKELLGSSTFGNGVHDFADLGLVPVLPWIPKTTAAVALRLLEFDRSIFYVLNEKAEPSEVKEDEEYTKIPSGYGRRGRSQGRGGKWLSKITGYSDNVNSGVRRQSRRKRNFQSAGSRTKVRRREEKKPVEETMLSHLAGIISPKVSGQPAMGAGKKVKMMDREGAGSGSKISGAVSDDDFQRGGHESGNWELGFDGFSNECTRNLMEVSDEDAMEASEAGNEIKMGDRDSKGEGDVHVSEGSHGIANRIQNHERSKSPVSEDFSE